MYLNRECSGMINSIAQLTCPEHTANTMSYFKQKILHPYEAFIFQKMKRNLAPGCI